MKYLVNRETKEHVVCRDEFCIRSDRWTLVEADSEGWIKHEGSECPLPDDVRCDIKCLDNSETKNSSLLAKDWGWTNPAITHYKPILEQAEPVQEPKPVVKDSLTTALLDKLKAAHKAAQQIPDLEAELREMLGSMGYTLGKLSPFVEPEAEVETPQEYTLPDKETLREIFTKYHESAYNPKSEHYRFEHFYKALLAHSRPAKGE